jgi:hypothetical protein
MMQALLAQLMRPGDAGLAEHSEGALSLVYYTLSDRHAAREQIRGHTARDLAWSRRQVNSHDPFIDRCLERSLNHLAKVPKPARWDEAMTSLEASRTWIERYRRFFASGTSRQAEPCLVRAEAALARARELLPLPPDLTSLLKIERARAELRSLEGEPEAALAQVDEALVAAQEHALGFQLKELLALRRHIQQQIS